jgi:hypothetical protein
MLSISERLEVRPASPEVDPSPIEVKIANLEADLGLNSPLKIATEAAL